jgi:hypothetical protein
VGRSAVYDQQHEQDEDNERDGDAQRYPEHLFPPALSSGRFLEPVASAGQLHNSRIGPKGSTGTQTCRTKVPSFAIAARIPLKTAAHSTPPPPILPHASVGIDNSQNRMNN